MIALLLAVVAYSGSAPQVVAVSPAVGAEVPAGKIQVKVTFDRPMMAGSQSFVAVRAPENTPKCAPSATQSADGKTFTLDCIVEAGRDYWIGFNNARFQNFRSVDGVPAEPAMLQFSAR